MPPDHRRMVGQVLPGLLVEADHVLGDSAIQQLIQTYEEIANHWVEDLSVYDPEAPTSVRTGKECQQMTDGASFL